MHSVSSVVQAEQLFKLAIDFGFYLVGKKKQQKKTDTSISGEHAIVPASDDVKTAQSFGCTPQHILSQTATGFFLSKEHRAATTVS